MRGVMIQLQVINALMLREVKTRYGDHEWGYAWAFIGPLLWVLMFLAMYHFMGRLAPPGMSVMGFLITGVITFEFFKATSSQAVAAISGNKGLLLFPQVRPLDLVMARVLLEAATQFVVFVLLMGVAALIEGELRINSLLTTFAGLLLAMGLGAGLGLVLCGLSTLSPTVEKIHGPLVRPMFWLSAVFYSVDSAPVVFKEILLYNPVVHAIELVREGWFPGYQSRHIDPWYAALWILLLLFFGLSLERVVRRKLELS